MTPSPKSRVSRPPAPSYRRMSFDLAADLKHALALAAVYEDRPMVAIVPPGRECHNTNHSRI